MRSRGPSFSPRCPVAEEEANETEYWLELLDELQHAPDAPLRKRRDEAHQITSMIVASVKTAREEG
jgi:four helix bundle protein